MRRAGKTEANRSGERNVQMKLIIQIPCFNEEETLPATLADLPRAIPGIDEIEWLIVDDGSTDRTVEVAKAHGVRHIVGFTTNLGLASAFRAGLNTCIERGADIIVNTDADNQYAGADIAKLVQPIIEKKADIVIGDRQIWQHKEFSLPKKVLQKLGSRVVSSLAETEVPDVTSGFRAYNREAAHRVTVLSDYTYTHETIIQAHSKGLTIASVPIGVNPKTRDSRLFGSPLSYIRKSAPVILRIYTLYQPLKVFTLLAFIPFVCGLFLGVRFLVYKHLGEGDGHVQSLILAAILLNLSFVLMVLGILADLIGFNRKLIDEAVLLLRHNKSAAAPLRDGASESTTRNDGES